MAMGTSAPLGEEKNTEKKVMKLRGQGVKRIVYMGVKVTKN